MTNIWFIKIQAILRQNEFCENKITLLQTFPRLQKVDCSWPITFYFCWHTGIYSKWFEHNQNVVVDYACFPDDKLLTTLCGKQRNLTISSQSNSLLLVFTSDYFQEGRGFKIYARSRNANSSNRPRGPGNITTNKCSIEHHTWINCYHCNYIQ